MPLPDVQTLGHNRRFCELLVVLAAFCWSLSGVTVRFIDSATEWQIVFYRALAFLVFVILMLDRRQILSGLREAGLLGLVGGCSLGVCFISFIYAMTHATIANAIFLLSAYPIIASLLAVIVLKEILTGRATAAILMGFVGVSVMLLHGWEADRMFGNMMGLLAASGYAVYSVCVRAGKERDMTPSLIYAGLFAMLISGFVLQTQQGFAISAYDFILCMVLGFVAIGVGFYLFTLGSRGLQTSELTLLALLEIVLGILWVWIFAGEVPSQSTFIGGAIVMAAVIFRTLGTEPESSAVQTKRRTASDPT